MVTTILGRKLGMTQVWSEDDRLLPVTVIEAGPCVVTQLKTMKRDGYRAVQIGFGEVRKDRDGNARINKPLAGHFAKAKVEAKKFLAEVRLGDDDNMHVGQTITVDVPRRRQARSRDRYEQGQGLRRRHEASQLQGRSWRPRFALPPCSRVRSVSARRRHAFSRA